MATLQDYADRLAYNQHGGIMGYVRNDAGEFEGPRILDLFVTEGRLTCVALEKAGAAGTLDAELGFRGDVIRWAEGPLTRLLDCDQMLIGLAD